MATGFSVRSFVFGLSILIVFILGTVVFMVAKMAVVTSIVGVVGSFTFGCGQSGAFMIMWSRILPPAFMISQRKW